MKNNKGFTLVELMAVIVILAVIISIAVPSAISISKKIKSKMYDTKVNMIMDSAKIYGRDNYSDVAPETNQCAKPIKVSKLVELGYIKRDDTENNIVENPKDGSSMNDFEVCIYKKYNRIYVKPNNCGIWNKNNDLTNYCK